VVLKAFTDWDPSLVNPAPTAVRVVDFDPKRMLRRKGIDITMHRTVNTIIPGKLHGAIVIPIVWVTLPVTWQPHCIRGLVEASISDQFRV
jgi:hypothetical protein